MCLYPVIAYRSQGGPNPGTGKVPLVFKQENADLTQKIKLPCGQCIECRLEKSRQWAMRCVNEASLHVNNCFITLTYDENNIARCQQGLNKRDFVLFMKRLRKKYGRVRFFHCGEYGENFNRPHHHACLFGYDFLDKEHWATKNGVPLYRSKMLEELWPYGYSTIGQVTWESAAYVARYVTKKLTGARASEYEGRTPEYITMSRRPGIGSEFYDKYKNDIYGHDNLVIRDNLICRPPKYYDTKYDIEDPERLEKLKEKRRAKIKDREVSVEKAVYREKVWAQKTKQLNRSFEKGE